MTATIEQDDAVRDYLLSVGYPRHLVIELVGPKGYVHGWRFVGLPGGGTEKDALIHHLVNDHHVSEAMLRRGGGPGGSSRSLGDLLKTHEAFGKAQHASGNDAHSQLHSEYGYVGRSASGIEPGWSGVKSGATGTRHSHESDAHPSDEFMSDRTELESHLIGTHNDTVLRDSPQKVSMAQLRRRHDDMHGASRHQVAERNLKGVLSPAPPRHSPAAEQKSMRQASSNLPKPVPSLTARQKAARDVARSRPPKANPATLREQQRMREQIARTPRSRPGRDSSGVPLMQRIKPNGSYNRKYLSAHTDAELSAALQSEHDRLQSPTIGYDASRRASKAMDSIMAEQKRRGQPSKTRQATFITGATPRAREASRTRSGNVPPVKPGAPLRGTAATSHDQLLAARKAARAKYPAGHPTRLKAERAVRASQRARRNK